LPFLHQPLVKLVAPSYEGTLNPADQFERDQELKRELAAAGIDPESLRSEPSLDREFVDGTRDGTTDPYLRLVEAVGRTRLASSLPFQRRTLSGVLNYWLQLGGVRQQLEWSGPKPQVQLGGHGLIGALTVQLLFDCSRTDGLAVCASCGTPFLPGSRRPRRDRNTYCSDCGLKAAARDAAARYRQTQKYRATYQKWLNDLRQPNAG
jgi:hypothetical protein